MTDFLTELKRLSEAATTRPWEHRIHERIQTPPDKAGMSTLVAYGYDDFTGDDTCLHLTEDDGALITFLANRAERIAAFIEAADEFVSAWHGGHSLATPLANYMAARNAMDEGGASNAN